MQAPASSQRLTAHQVARGAREARAQLLTLAGDADRAVVGVANARHNAAGGNHGHGAKAVFIATQGSRHQHITPRAHATVHAQHHALPQLIPDQALRNTASS